jgi:hypothetical protein
MHRDGGLRLRLTRPTRFRLAAAEAWVRAAIYDHYGKHLFADRADEFRRAHDAMLRC